MSRRVTDYIASSLYLGTQFAGSVEQKLPNLGSTAMVVTTLRGDGLDLPDVWKTEARSYDLAQWLAVKSRVRLLALQSGKTEDALRQNRIVLQALMRDNSWLHVLNPTVDPKAATNRLIGIGPRLMGCAEPTAEPRRSRCSFR